jgi:hypothetical protein
MSWAISQLKQHIWESREEDRVAATIKALVGATKIFELMNHYSKSRQAF